MLNSRYIFLLAIILPTIFCNFAMEQKDSPILYEELKEDINLSELRDEEFEESDEDDPAKDEQDFRDEEQEIRKLSDELDEANKRQRLAKIDFKHKKLQLKNKINDALGSNFRNFSEAKSFIDREIKGIIPESEAKDLENKNHPKLVSLKQNKKKLSKTQINNKKKMSIIDLKNWSYGAIGWSVGILALLTLWGYNFYHDHDENESSD